MFQAAILEGRAGGRAAAAAWRTMFWLLNDLPFALERALDRDPRGPGLVPQQFYPESMRTTALLPSISNGTRAESASANMVGHRQGITELPLQFVQAARAEDAHAYGSCENVCR